MTNDKLRNYTWFYLAGLIIIAFLIRIYFSSLRTIHESWDSPVYIWMARCIGQGYGIRLWPGAPAHTWFQPFYSFLAGLVGNVIGYEAGGYMISCLFGSLLILPVFKLAHLLFGKSAGWIAAFIIAFYYRMIEASTFVLTEMMYSFLWLFGLYYAFRLIIYNHRRPIDYLCCGLFLGMAALTRTEANFDFAIIFAILIVIVVRQRLKPWNLFLLLGTYSLFIIPYMFFLYREMHVITFTGRVIRTVFVAVNTQNESYEFFSGSPVSYVVHHPIAALRRVIVNSEYILRKHGIWAFHPMLTLLMGLSLFGKYWSSFDFRRTILLLVFLIYPWLTYYGVTGTLNRYYYMSIVLVIILAADGIAYLQEWFVKSEAFLPVRSSMKETSFRKTIAVVLVLILLLCNVTPLVNAAVTGHFPEHGDQVKDKEIGVWIRGHINISTPAILCACPRIPYYANGLFYGDNDRNLNMNNLQAFIKKSGINVLVVDDFFAEQWFPRLQALKDPQNAPSWLQFKGSVHYRYDTGLTGDALIYQVRQ